ncbi:MAG: hypothetical protein N3D11_16710 [Candidatus Sumerlaeia bacterium]|nr:hypothetical protein [Candidatus Sumerlaeia bacterium]
MMSKKFLLVLLCALVLGLGMACRTSASAPLGARAQSGIIPASLFPRTPRGLALIGSIERLSPQDLWKRINGAADLFISYGFRELLAGSFGRDDLPQLEVSIYEMGGDLNALGVYLQERTEGSEPLNLGWGGHRSGEGVFFHKGPYYVKIIDLTDRAQRGSLAETVARQIDQAIRLDRRTMTEMTVFPAEGLVPGSILYEHRDAMGHGFLQRVFKADYTIGGQTATLFYCRQPNAEGLLGKYRDFAKHFGKIEREWQEDGLRLITVVAFGKTETIFLQGDVFGGLVGCSDTETALRLIRALLNNLQAANGGR